MKKINLKNILDIILLIVFLNVGITGIIIFPDLLKIMGININNLPKVTIYKYHHWLGIILLILSIVHIKNYWKLLIYNTKKFFNEIINLKKKLILIINISLIISFFLVFITGILKFPGFIPFLNLNQLYFSLNLISFIHDYSGFISIILSIIHIILYLKIFLIKIKKTFN